MALILPSIGSGIIASPTSAPAWNGNTYSVDFDGSDDYLACGTSSLINSVGSYSVSAWVNMDASGSGGVFLASGTSNTNRIFLSLNTSGVLFGNKTGGGGVASYSSTLSTGAWYHVVGVKDGTTAYIYVNGAQQATASVSATLGSTAGTNFQIGATPAVAMTASQFPGLIDEVALFSTVLSASDVSSIYNSGTPADISSYSPVHWWRMGDNDGGTGTTITDQGSGGNNGTLTNGPTFSTDVPAFNTYSVDFDGSNDYMSISDADIFSLGNGSGTDNAFSISGWIYPPTGDGSQTFYVATKDASGSREWAFRTVVGELHFFAFGTGGGYIGRKDSTVLSNAQWYHVAMTYDGSKASSGIKLYVDGTRVDDADYASGTYTAAKNTSAEVRVSALQVNNTYSDGLIDELSIFNTELSASDITAIYNSGVPADISSLSPVGWWRMGDNDSGTGTTITDQGSGGNDGTLTNGPTFSTTVPS